MTDSKIHVFTSECQKIYESAGSYTTLCVVHTNVLISENTVLKCFLNTQVKLWITFNEAFVVAWLGYGIGVFAPGVSSADTGAYEVAHNIIRSHTRAYRTYETSFKTLQQGASIIGFQHLSVLS